MIRFISAISLMFTVFVFNTFAEDKDRLLSEIEAMTCLDKISLATLATAEAGKIAAERGQVEQAATLKSKSDNLMQEMQKYMFGTLLDGSPEGLAEVQATNSPAAMERFERIAFGARKTLSDNSVPLSVYTNSANMCLNDS